MKKTESPKRRTRMTQSTTKTVPTTAVVVKEVTQSLQSLKIPKTFTVTSLTEYNQGAIYLDHITQLEKTAKQKEDAIIKPIQLGINTLRAELQPMKDILTEHKRSIKLSMDTFRAEENARVEAERQRILKDQRLKSETAVKKVEAIAAPSFGNVRKVLELVVTDESLIPREFFDLNVARLKQYLRDSNAVEGAHVHYVETTVSR